MDTPFARIDQTHRENIANNFLKTISRQVIMLSTDSEIDSNLYKVINNLISKEYLLDYDENNEKTNVKDNYFFESEANYGI
ncbi:MAG: DNA sulfur modification protein DndD, partial [Bacillota bacterium]|nr:DNA sulfur modification protein DndD [Bacillota bacterium]